MRIAILDAAAGISGDMTLGALLDAGVEPAWLEALPSRLGFDDVAVRVRSVERSSVRATKVDFVIPGEPGAESTDEHHGNHRHGRHIGELIEHVRRAPVSDWVRERAVEAFRLVGEAEGRVHGVEPDRVHLHELGAIDAVLDLVGAIEGFERLGVDRIFNLPIALGKGWVKTSHGSLPIPAPATALLLEGVDIRTDGPVDGEATTPTGAALIRVLSQGPPPSRWRAISVAWGAGDRDPEHYPNILRLMLAETSGEAGMVDVVVTDIDDMQPEYLEPLRAAVLEAGAVDCAVWPTQGKKGRVGFHVEALVPPGRSESVTAAVFANSTTAGIRTWTATRQTLRRREIAVEMAPSVSVRVKLWEDWRAEGTSPHLKPEYEDVVRAAKQLKQPPLEVAEAARQEARKHLRKEALESEERISE